MRQRVIDVLGHEGRFIFAPAHAVTPDIRFKNVLTMVNVVKKYEWFK
jgi:uroporphyrinogen-III decarboxylase